MRELVPHGLCLGKNEVRLSVEREHGEGVGGSQ